MPAFANPVEQFKKEDAPAVKRPGMAMTDCRMARTLAAVSPVRRVLRINRSPTLLGASLLSNS